MQASSALAVGVVGLLTPAAPAPRRDPATQTHHLLAQPRERLLDHSPGSGAELGVSMLERGWPTMPSRAGPARSPSGDALTTEPAPLRDAYLSAAEVAAILGIGKRTVERMAVAGDLPARKVSRYWRFRSEAIRQWFIDGESL